MAPKTNVIITKKEQGETDATCTLRSLRIFDAKRFFTGTEQILINPNWIIAEHYSQGNTTSTETLEGIVQYLLEDVGIPSKNIIIGDGGYPSETDEAMQINDIYRLKDKYGIIVRNLNNDVRIEKSPENPLALKNIKIAQTAEDVDVIISVPSLKTHSMATTTLSMKNLMGILLPKGIMHSHLSKKIADLCGVFRKKMYFSIIDGFIGSQGMEEGGSPVQMDLMLISEDPVALDTVGSSVMGYSPDEVDYLQYAHKKGLGTCQLDEIEIIGESIKNVKKNFYR